MARTRWIWSYRDFFLSIEHGKVEGRFSGAREDADLELPVTSEEIAELWEGKGRVQEIGNRLYKAVFSREVLELLRTAKNSLLPWEGLRLRFETKSPEALEWPLETLHDGKSFLAFQKDSLIVRHQGPLRKLPTLWAFPPLRVLVVTASPKGPEPLEVEQELSAIQEALEPLRKKRRVEVDRLENPTFAALSNKLDGKNYHVLHFIGHGAFNRTDGRGLIYLADSSGSAHPVEGSALAVLLEPHSSIRLVVLNTCEGAVTRGDRFLGVAQALIHQGIPAVLAMQGKIPDPIALLFSRRFYERLAKGRPIDRALRKTRHEMFVAAPSRADWAMPVLVLGAKNGKLFTWLPTWRSTLILALALSLVLLALWSEPWKPHCPKPKAVDMDLVWIEPAPGSGISKPFCLSAREVSVGEWEAVMGANSLPTGQGGAEFPAGASYYDGLAFIDKLNVSEGERVYRLPTDAEWGYAAHGPGASQEGNCQGSDDYDGLAPVGTFKTNDWGLYDMVGNVWEWVEAPGDAPDERVRRGGAYNTSRSCLADKRSSVKAKDNRKDTGIRVLREIPGK